jgi:hypothetical protein
VIVKTTLKESKEEGMYKEKITKIAETIGISSELAKNIVLRHHELKYLFSQDELGSIDITLDKKTVADYLEKVSKALCVSQEAIVYEALMRELEE